MTGQLDILNCGEGHLEIKFDEKDPIEVERAKRIIGDMLKRGYALFIHGKGDTLIRVKKFLAKAGVYIIADGPTIPAEAEPLPVTKLPLTKGKAKFAMVPMHKAKATVVGRSAGG